MTQNSRTSRSLIALTLATALLLGACSSDGSDGTAPTTTEAEGATPTTAPEGDEPTTTADTTDGGGETGDRQAYLDAFVENFDPDGEVFELSQVECLAEGYLDVIGLENLVDAGVTPEDYAQGSDFPDEVGLDEDKANAIYDQFDACDIDLKEVFLGAIEMFSEEPLTDEQQSCADDVLTDEKLRASFVADLLELEGESQDPLDELSECIPDSLGTGGPDVEPVEPPVSGPVTSAPGN